MSPEARKELRNPRHALKRGDAGAWEVFLTECGSTAHRAHSGAAQKNFFECGWNKPGHGAGATHHPRRPALSLTF
jgi:hypothetical protein